MANDTIFSTLDAILSNSNIEDVTTESAGFSALPDGYYLCEVVKAELKSNKEGKPMAAFQLKAVEKAINVTFDEKTAAPIFNEIDKTKGRMLFKYYVFSDEQSVKRFVSDMLKFEDATTQETILGKEYFLTSELIEDALDVLIGMTIYIELATNDKGSQWANMISWKTAGKLGLPE